ncbi:MAG: response regulator [Acidobacteria bacterium]|nr:response regulator [Acidobacteriota bacterium]MBV9147500.1 response regulator [Acidobacteriota bacterium]MBV9435477.1 response regulator [Acidobacteriota bacterium]
MPPLRMLFVDDEPSIRLTLPQILRMKGYDVEVASTVTEALTAIQSRSFDVLLSDLNIGNAGDGFTVVSAMRRTQPDCITLILTGYPGFETALQAIRSQVDDYLVKPTQIERLIETIERKVRQRAHHEPLPLKRVAEIIDDNRDEIISRAVSFICKEKASRGTSLRQGLPDLLSAMTEALSSGVTDTSLSQGAEHGKLRRRQGCSINDLFEEFRALERAVYEMVQENLLTADVSNLVPDLRAFNDHVQDVLRYAVNAHLGENVAA